MGDKMDKLIKEINSKGFNYKRFLKNSDQNTLIELKKYLDDLYYNSDVKDIPISDELYDELKAYLKSKGYIPTVGATLRENDNKEKLPYWLGSVDKVTPEEVGEFERWKAKNKAPDYVVSVKLDGVSCLLIFDGNKYTLYTRGNGIEGANISYIHSYLNLPRLEDPIAIRGELVMKKDVFSKKYDKNKVENGYANPRNMVAGLINAKTQRAGLTDLDFVPYEIILNEGETHKPKTLLKHLAKLNFLQIEYKILSSDELTISNLFEMLKEYKKSYSYELDGLVIQPNIPYERNIEGNPSYLLGFKANLSENVFTTVVTDVEWNISKTGQYKPVVLVEDVKTGGVTIKRATAHNAKYIVDNDIGPGTVIKITRSKDVIPFIVEIVESTRAKMPDDDYTWDKTFTNIIASSSEDNANNMCIRALTFFFQTIGVKFLSEETVKKIYKAGFNSLVKILDATEEDFLTIPTFKNATVKRIYEGIHKALDGVKISTIAVASGLLGFGVGEKKIQSLVEYYPDIFTSKETFTKEQINKIEGFSDIMTNRVISNLDYARKFVKMIKKYARYETEQIVISNKLAGKKFVFTEFRDKDLEEIIKSLGGQVPGSVSRNTTAVIVKDRSLNVNTTKTQKAKALGIPIISLEEFKNNYLS